MRLARGLAAAACVIALDATPRAENIDPNGDGSRHAYAENLGWINAEPSGNGGPGVQVGDSELSGYMWGENVGWTSLSCQNTLSCGTEAYGVTNDGTGQLAGHAWSENAGWISFSCTNTASCGTSGYGVTIDPATGIFSGFAYGENIGWISLNCTNTASCGATDYRVQSAWVCDPRPPGPNLPPVLQVDKLAGDAVVRWSVVLGATGSDVVRGSLEDLRLSGGDFSASTTTCLGDNRTGTSALDAGSPAPGDGIWYLARGQNCGGSGSCDVGAPPQSGSRDAEIAASGNACP